MTRGIGIKLRLISISIRGLNLPTVFARSVRKNCILIWIFFQMTTAKLGYFIVGFVGP